MNIKFLLLKTIALLISLIIPTLSSAQCFTPVTNYTAAAGPQAVVSDDFNGDGKLDLAIVNNTSQNVSILLGNGSGGFSLPSNISTFSNIIAIASGDFNSDGKIDLAIPNWLAGTVMIFSGNGTGGFTFTANITVGSEPLAIKSSDINGDGIKDLVLTRYTAGVVTILLGNGTGGFSPATHFQVGNAPCDVTCGDFNGDGKIDIAAAIGGADLSVIFGNGIGGFGAPTNYYIGTNPRSIFNADFNNDGNLDLVTADYGSNAISIFLGNSSGNFSSATHFPVGSGPNSLVAADFNVDGKLDIATSNVLSGNISIIIGNGSGGFSTATNFGVGIAPSSIICRDFNGDSRMDFATVDYNSNNANILLSSNYNLNTSINNGTCNGTGSATVSAIGGNGPYSYLWNSTPTQTTQIATNLFSGNYTVLAKDASGCNSSKTITISQPPVMLISSNSTSVNCFGDNNGIASVTVTANGTPPYSYQWSNGQTTQTATGLTGGNHTVIVTNGAGCSVTQTVIISQAPAMTLNINKTNESCVGCNNGAASVSVTANGTAPFTYSWSNGSTQSTVSNLSPGNYTITVTDANNCSLNQNITILAALTFTQACNQWMKSVPGNLTGDRFSGDMMVDANDNLYISGSDQYFLSKYNNNGNLVWNKTKAGLSASDIILTNNNDIYATSSGALLCKFDASGNELFTPITVANTDPHSISTDNNNVYIVGKVTGNAVFGANTYSTGLFIVKYNSAGQLLWSKNVLSTGSFGTNAIITDGSYVYVASTTFIPSSGQASSISIGSVSSASITGVCLMKLDINGNVIWIKQGNTVGSSGLNSVVIDMTFDSYHNILYSGWAGSGFPMGVKVDTSGLNEQGIQVNAMAQHIKSDNNGKYFIAGANPYNSMTNKEMIFTLGNLSTSTNTYFGAKHTSSNTLEKKYLLGLSQTGTMYAAFEPIGTAYVDMNTINNNSGNIVIAKFNHDGRMLPDFTPNQSITCGDPVSLGPNISTYPNFIQQINFSNQTFSWTPSSGLSSSSILSPIASPTTNTQYSVNIGYVDTFNVFHTTRSCPSIVNVTVSNPSLFSYTTNSMVASFSITGSGCTSFLWDFGNGNTSSINPNPIVTFASPGTYSVCLRCNSQPNQCVKCLTVTVPGNSAGAIGVTEIEKNNSITVAPNPFSQETTVTFYEELTNASAKLIDIQGREIKSILFSGNQLVIEKGEIKEGIYFLQIRNPQQQLIVTRKLIIQ